LETRPSTREDERPGESQLAEHRGLGYSSVLRVANASSFGTGSGDPATAAMHRPERPLLPDGSFARINRRLAR
jgi:hypothetical protein